ncbi:hypothetical protein QB910_000129 [Dabrowskivirus KKP3916]|uniref:DUF2786 domain-containing protein n=1 Tax=Alicyclobacillus phage KKP_3916 TaxID=3040651 RepID=A0AAT9V7S1_9CAUD|nr:hypothetical protein QB910_000129 [Alicyclobacillus phage KKP 3916]
MDDRQKAFVKIQKLLALAGDKANEDESKSALLKAQELMLKFNIEHSEVGSTTQNKIVKHVPATDIEKNLPWWKSTLAVIIAENFRCFYYRQHFGREGKQIFIVGLEPDVDIAVDIFKFAVSSISYNSKAFIREWRKQWASWAPERNNVKGVTNDWIRGFLEGLKTSFHDQVEKNNWGIVLSKDVLVEEEYKSMDLRKARAGRIGFNNDNEAFGAGFENGKNFNNSRESKKLHA